MISSRSGWVAIALGALLWGAGCGEGDGSPARPADAAADAGPDGMGIVELDGGLGGGGPGDGGPGDGGPGGGELSDGGPSDGEPSDGEPNGGEPGDGGPGDAEPGDGEPSDAAVADAEPPGEHICDNFIDDDVDGLIDCQDPDCSDAQRCQPERCANGVDDDLDGDLDCADEECWFADGCDGPTPFTQAEVQVVFNQRCGCHTGAVMLGGLTLVEPFTDTTLGVPARLPGVELDLLVPGDREASFLYLKLTPDLLPEQGDRMPPEQPFIDDVRVERIGRWIDGLE